MMSVMKFEARSDDQAGLASKVLHALLLESGNGFLLSSEALILLTKAPIHKSICFAQLPVFNQKCLFPLQYESRICINCCKGHREKRAYALFDSRHWGGVVPVKHAAAVTQLVVTLSTASCTD